MQGLIVVRHGVTKSNLEGKLNGRDDQPLHPSAYDSLIDTASRIAEFGIERVLVSPMLRARQSAEVICSRWAFRGVETEIREALRELDFGSFEGLSRDQLLASRLAPHYKAWMSLAPGAPSALEGESWESAVARARSVIEEIASDGRFSLVVGHGYMLRLMIVVAIGLLPPQSVWQFPMENAAWSLLDRQEGIWRLCRHNVPPGAIG